MTSRLNSRDRLIRLLAVIPWTTQQPDGARLAEIAKRFDYPPDQLLDDLQQVVFFVGVHPFSPDALIEVEIAGDRVHIRYADWFSRPLKLTAAEGARLLTAGRSVLSLSEGHSDGEGGDLLRALAKLDNALGEGAHQTVEVRLGDTSGDTLAVLQAAAAAGVQVELDYYSYGRDELTSRTVDPARVFSDHGNWYLSGWCHSADGERVFRLDRVRQAIATDRPVSVADPGVVTTFSPSGDHPRVELLLHPRARWVIEQYPIDWVKETADGLHVRLAVTAVPWLERLLLRLGPDGRLLTVEPPLSLDARATAAARVLRRYQP